MAGLIKVIDGKVADGQPRVMRAVTGVGYRVINSSGGVVGAGTADSTGLASISGTYPVTGYVQGYSDPGTWASPISGQRYPASGNTTIAAGNIFDRDAASIPTRGLLSIIATDASYYYPTSQAGGPHSHIVEGGPTGTEYLFIMVRKGGRDYLLDFIDPNGIHRSDGKGAGSYWGFRYNKALGAIDQGPVRLGDSLDGHESFIWDMAPSGQIRIVMNCYQATTGFIPLQYSATTTNYDITTFSAPVNVGGVPGGLLLSGAAEYVIAPDGTNYCTIIETGGPIWFGSGPSGSTTWSFTKVVDSLNPAGSYSNWGCLGGMFAFDNNNPSKVGIVLGGYKGTLGYDDAYQNLFYVESVDNFASARRADGTALALPLRFNETTGMLYANNGSGGVGTTPADWVKVGHNYGSWAKLTFWNNRPMILDDGDRVTYGDPQGISRWNGSAWVRNPINELLSNESPGVTRCPPAYPNQANNWGVTIGEKAGTVTVYFTMWHTFNDAMFTHSGSTGPQLMRARSSDGFNTYTLETIVEGGPYSGGKVPYFAYDVLDPFYSGEGGWEGSAGAYSYMTGFCYPKHPKNNTDIVIASAVDYTNSTVFMVDTSVASAPLTLDPDAGWSQTGNTLHVNSPSGSRETVTAQVYSQGGGVVSFIGADAAKFSLSSDGTTWTSTLTIPSGLSTVYLSVLPGSSDIQLHASVGVPT